MKTAERTNRCSSHQHNCRKALSVVRSDVLFPYKNACCYTSLLFHTRLKSFSRRFFAVENFDFSFLLRQSPHQTTHTEDSTANYARKMRLSPNTPPKSGLFTSVASETFRTKRFSWCWLLSSESCFLSPSAKHLLKAPKSDRLQLLFFTSTDGPTEKKNQP